VKITRLEADVAKGRAKILKSKVLYTGKVFRLLRDTVIEPGGVRANRDIIVHPGSVVVLPVFADGRVLLIRQYRHTVGGFLWELVAGRKAAGIARGNRVHGAAVAEIAAHYSYAGICEGMDVDFCGRGVG
jgi:hypothetical protein